MGVGEFCMLLLSSGLASLYLNGRYIDVHVYVFVVWRYHAHQECTQHTDVVIMDDIVGVCVCVNVWHMFACMKTCNGACMNTCAWRPCIVCDCEGFGVASCLFVV